MAARPLLLPAQRGHQLEGSGNGNRLTMDTAAAMETLQIGARVLYEGQPCLVEGFDPMSVPERRLYLRREHDGEEFSVPLVVKRAWLPETTFARAEGVTQLRRG